MKFFTFLLIAAVAYIAVADQGSSRGSTSANGQGNFTSNGSLNFTSGGAFNFSSGGAFNFSGATDNRGGNSNYGNSGRGYSGFQALQALVSFNTTTADPVTSSFIDGKLNATLSVSTSAPATVYWFAINKFSSDIDIGKHGITASIGGSSLGYGLIVSPSNVNITAATLTINTDLSKFGDRIGLFYISAATHFYGQVSTSVVGNATVYNLIQDTTAIYFIGKIDKTASIPLLFNTPCQLNGGDRHSISFDSGLSLNITNSANSTLIVTPSAGNSGKIPDRARAIGIFFNISVDVQSQLNATLSYSFNATLLIASGIRPSSLRWAVYNETTATWTFLTSGFSIDLDAQVVYQQVGHFSQWAVYSADTSASSVGGDGSTTNSVTGGNGTAGAASSVVYSAFAVMFAIAFLL